MEKYIHPRGVFNLESSSTAKLGIPFSQASPACFSRVCLHFFLDKQVAFFKSCQPRLIALPRVAARGDDTSLPPIKFNDTCHRRENILPSSRAGRNKKKPIANTVDVHAGRVRTLSEENTRKKLIDHLKQSLLWLSVAAQTHLLC